MRIAARRPTTAAIVHELTSSLQWMQLAKVRHTLASNPFTPTQVALLLAATCRLQLGELVRANVHPHVRELARALWRSSSTRSVERGHQNSV